MNIDQRLRTLSARILRYQVEFMQLKAEAARQGDGAVTRYSVRATRVKAHTRRAYQAIRFIP